MNPKDLIVLGLLRFSLLKILMNLDSTTYFVPHGVFKA